MNLVEYPDREFLWLSLADTLAGQIGDFLRREGRAALAVPGGTTPGPAFDTLSGVDLEWASVTVLPTDERWVPESSPRSNSAMIRRRLLAGRAAAARFLPICEPSAEPDAALPALAEAVAGVLPLSVALLGMGEDGHLASLFPGDPALAAALAADAPPLVATREPATGEARVTLSAPALRSAMHLHLLILGPRKRAALERAAGLPVEAAPVRLVLDEATVHWAE